MGNTEAKPFFAETNASATNGSAQGAGLSFVASPLTPCNSKSDFNSSASSSWSDNDCSSTSLSSSHDLNSSITLGIYPLVPEKRASFSRSQLGRSSDGMLDENQGHKHALQEEKHSFSDYRDPCSRQCESNECAENKSLGTPLPRIPKIKNVEVPFTNRVKGSLRQSVPGFIQDSNPKLFNRAEQKTIDLGVYRGHEKKKSPIIHHSTPQSCLSLDIDHSILDEAAASPEDATSGELLARRGVCHPRKSFSIAQRSSDVLSKAGLLPTPDPAVSFDSTLVEAAHSNMTAPKVPRLNLFWTSNSQSEETQPPTPQLCEICLGDWLDRESSTSQGDSRCPRPYTTRSRVNELKDGSHEVDLTFIERALGTEDARKTDSRANPRSVHESRKDRKVLTMHTERSEYSGRPVSTISSVSRSTQIASKSAQGYIVAPLRPGISRPTLGLKSAYPMVYDCHEKQFFEKEQRSFEKRVLDSRVGADHSSEKTSSNRTQLLSNPRNHEMAVNKQGDHLQQDRSIVIRRRACREENNATASSWKALNEEKEAKVTVATTATDSIRTEMGAKLIDNVLQPCINWNNVKNICDLDKRIIHCQSEQARRNFGQSQHDSVTDSVKEMSQPLLSPTSQLNAGRVNNGGSQGIVSFTIIIILYSCFWASVAALQQLSFYKRFKPHNLEKRFGTQILPFLVALGTLGTGAFSGIVVIGMFIFCSQILGSKVSVVLSPVQFFIKTPAEDKQVLGCGLGSKSLTPFNQSPRMRDQTDCSHINCQWLSQAHQSFDATRSLQLLEKCRSMCSSTGCPEWFSCPSMSQGRLEYDSAIPAVGVPTSFNPSAYSIGLPVSPVKTEDKSLGLRGSFNAIWDNEIVQALLCVWLLGCSRLLWVKGLETSSQVIGLNVSLFFTFITVVWGIEGLRLSRESRLASQFGWRQICLSSLSFATAIVLLGAKIDSGNIFAITSDQVGPHLSSLQGWSLGPLGLALYQCDLSLDECRTSAPNSKFYLFFSGLFYASFIVISQRSIHQRKSTSIYHKAFYCICLQFTTAIFSGVVLVLLYILFNPFLNEQVSVRQNQVNQHQLILQIVQVPINWIFLISLLAFAQIQFVATFQLFGIVIGIFIDLMYGVNVSPLQGFCAGILTCCLCMLTIFEATRNRDQCKEFRGVT